jgi:hypothetical protein
VISNLYNKKLNAYSLLKVHEMIAYVQVDLVSR